MEKPSLRPAGISDFIEWRAGGLLELSPKFQRRRVWPPKARAYLIDTIIRGLPVPKLYMRQHLNQARQICREVVDGQQRVAAVLDFYDSRLKLPADHDLFPNATFETLPQGEQDKFLKYEFSVDVLVDALDSDVLDIFARINSYSVPLNSQEKRNAKYFGSFRNTVYSLGLEHLEFWKSNRILSDQRIARMAEAELTSELLVAMIDGLQDKKKSLDGFYELWDDRFLYRTKAVSRFRDVIDLISRGVGSTLATSRFRGVALFYSLFMAVYERRYQELSMKGTKQGISDTELEGLRRTVVALSDVLSQGEAAPNRHNQLIQASSRQTDNIGPRRVRHNAILRAWAANIRE